MARYDFHGPGLKVRLTDPAVEGGVGVRIEHESGAALIVPSAPSHPQKDGLRVRVTGFDGTDFTLKIAPGFEQVEVQASRATAILGGQTAGVALRVEVGQNKPAPVRVTGHESTMPIDLDEG